MLRLTALLCLLTLPLLAQTPDPRLQPGDSDIPLQDWIDRIGGSTVYYYQNGRYIGREYYAPGSNQVTYQHESGTCEQGAWTYDEVSANYCFFWPSGDICVRHIARGDDILILPTQTPEDPMVDVQTVIPGGFSCTAAGVS